jgi:alkylation response protein AidB-like acyl-CoA dehydrogenase
MNDAGISTAELRESIREVLEAESPLTLVRLDREAARQPLGALWQKMAELGWFGLGIAEAHGGLGLGYRHLALLYEELGRFLTPLPVMGTLLTADAIARAGSEAQQRCWLAPIAAGEVRASLALPTGAVDLPRLDHDRTVGGEACDILNGDAVDELLVPVQDDAGRVYLALFHPGTPGIEVTPRRLIDLTRTMADVRLQGARVDAERLLPLDAATWTALLDHACLAIAGDAVGGTARILGDTVAYLGERRQFDRPIGSFQALKHRAATWKIESEGITALTRHCAELLSDRETGQSGLVSAAKARATESYLAVAGDAVQLHGGIGFTWEHECHLFLKRAALDAALFGTVLQHKDRAAYLSFGASLGPPRTPPSHESLRRFFNA